MAHQRSLIAGVLMASLTLGACVSAPKAPSLPVPAKLETVAVASAGDAADDAAIWVAPNSVDSLILGTDKREQGGLYVYGLDGQVRQKLAVGPMNNVDVRPLGDGERGLAIATHRRIGRIEVFTVAADTVTHLGGFDTTLADPYGACLGVAGEGVFYAAATATDDGFAQYTLRVSPDGGLDAALVRELQFGGQAEGCVFDDRTGDLFIGVEEAGLYRYSADPAKGDARETVALTSDLSLKADIEGVTIYPVGDDAGWLVASSQGDDSFALFSLPDAAFVGRVTITASEDGSVDAVTHTDGLDIVSEALPGFPAGLVVVQDDENERPDGVAATQNFKLVDWADVAEALALDK